MRVVIQRVSEASVSINQVVKAKIGLGFLVLVGIEEEDNQTDIDWICQKIIGLRIFSDENGLMNLAIQEVKGEILIISQFTLHAQTKKGNRPSFIKAAKPNVAVPIYENTIAVLEKLLGKKIQTGEFGADMQVSLVNDGPVTILIDSKNKE